jgi:hypothetical protein
MDVSILILDETARVCNERNYRMLIAYNRFMKCLFLFIAGGFAYGCVEIIFRGYSHISMFAAGGVCFILIGSLNEIYTWDMALISQMVISAFIITAVEFVAGIIVNVWLKLNVWDYSPLPYNFMGQICLLYTNIWFILSPFGILMDDYLRYFMLKEEKPHYKIF